MVSASVQVAGLKLKVDNVERERDFYFSKLRDIEILCQRPELQAIPVGCTACCAVIWGCRGGYSSGPCRCTLHSLLSDELTQLVGWQQ